jgi:NAD(P)-dependent dehydrogenase (short-subunit alcohol dehydrogenase family)
MSSSNVWFVTGAGRGLGLALLDELVSRGDRIVAAVRNPGDLRRYSTHERVLVTRLDVTDPSSVVEARDAALERFHRIDVLVNNAGRGLLGPIEETDDDEARQLFDTNFFGLLDVTRAILPTMRALRSGTVVNVSSVGGFTALAGSGIYAATKFAVEAITEGLSAELAGSGVRAMLIEPGAFRTDFLDARSIQVTRAEPLDDYRDTVHAGQPVFLAQNGRQVGDPRLAARAIVGAVYAPDPPFRLQLGADCVSRVEAKLHFVQAELNRWRAVSLSTDFDDDRESSVDVEDL